jgi:hypothetical protein
MLDSSSDDDAAGEQQQCKREDLVQPVVHACRTAMKMAGWYRHRKGCDAYWVAIAAAGGQMANFMAQMLTVSLLATWPLSPQQPTSPRKQQHPKEQQPKGPQMCLLQQLQSRPETAPGLAQHTAC